MGFFASGVVPFRLVTTNGSAAASISLAIPQSARSLMILIHQRHNTDVLGDILKMQFNGDTGNNYTDARGTSQSDFDFDSASALPSASSRTSDTLVWVPEYRNAGKKSVLANQSPGAVQRLNGSYDASGPITSVLFFIGDAGNFAAGARLVVIGY